MNKDSQKAIVGLSSQRVGRTVKERMRGTAVGVAEQPSCLGAIVRTWWRGEEGKPLKRAEENLFSYFNWSSLAAGWRV